MGIFEDVIINTKSAINVFGKKAGEIVDVSKLKINAVEVHNEISKKFEELGRLVYESKKDDTDVTDQINSTICCVDNLYHKLGSINEQIATMKKKCKCKDCGFLNEQDSLYCCKCGTKMEYEDSVEQNNEDTQESQSQAEIET